jgi:uncharacterized membrane protein YsdA (DUF1294 family)/cold shock CspA family protein
MNRVLRGRIADWKDDRGFGFIEPDSGGERVFVHVSSVVRGAPRPSVGDLVTYETRKSPDGKTRAVEVTPTGRVAFSRFLISKRAFLSLVAILVFPLLWWFVQRGLFPLWLLWAFAGMSALAFILYGLDKWAAKRDAQRTPESTLHFCGLLGGWPGALLAQQVFLHKSSKRSFQIAFWFVVVLNCGALGFALSPGGAEFIHGILVSNGLTGTGLHN